MVYSKKNKEAFLFELCVWKRSYLLHEFDKVKQELLCIMFNVILFTDVLNFIDSFLNFYDNLFTENLRLVLHFNMFNLPGTHFF